MNTVASPFIRMFSLPARQLIQTSAAGLAIFCGVFAADAGEPPPPIVHVDGLQTMANVLKDILPAVVVISSAHSVRQANSKKSGVARRSSVEVEVRAVGSGVVLDANQGLIVTNNHVIDRADDISVTLADGRDVQAKVLGRDPDTDVAVIKINADGLVAAIRSGDSSRLEVGDFVFAIGNPFQIGQTVTSGIVSGLHRRNIGVQKYEDFIQTDAAIYPGNSGGALINLRGELVGINTAFIGAGRSNPGVGFAIPINMVRSIADQLLEYGEVRRGELGASFQDSAPPPNYHAKSPYQPIGPIIAKVEAGSAADHAGLKAGDMVTDVDGSPVRDVPDLRGRLALLFAGESAEFRVLRTGLPFIFRVVLPRPEGARNHDNPLKASRRS